MPATTDDSATIAAPNARLVTGAAHRSVQPSASQRSGAAAGRSRQGAMKGSSSAGVWLMADPRWPLHAL